VYLKKKFNKPSSFSSFSSSCLQTACHLEWVVDPPLESSESTNHDDSCTETHPESFESDFVIDCTDLFHGGFIALSFVDDWHHGVCWVRDQGAEDTCPVPWQEGYHQLEWLGVLVFWLGKEVFVAGTNSHLESWKLDHGVGNLSEPKRRDAPVKAIQTFGWFDLVKSLGERSSKLTSLSSLHSDFKSFHWTE